MKKFMMVVVALLTMLLGAFLMWFILGFKPILELSEEARFMMVIVSLAFVPAVLALGDL